jgi:hypothetical protein
MPVQKNITALFRLSLTPRRITRNIFYPEIKELNQQILQQGQLKLQRLERKKFNDKMPP